MEALKIAAIALVIAVLALSLKKDQPAYSFLISAAGALLLLTLALRKFLPLLDWLRTLGNYTQTQSVACLLQVLGIAVATQLAADLCKDAGLTAAASGAELCGRLLALIQALPLLRSLVDTFLQYLS